MMNWIGDGKGRQRKGGRYIPRTAITIFAGVMHGLKRKQSPGLGVL